MVETTLMLLLLACLAFISFPLAVPYTMKAKRQARIIRFWENSAPMELYSADAGEKKR